MRIRQGLLALLGFLDEEAGWARPLILESERLVIAEASGRLASAVREVLDAGRGQVIVGSQLTPPTSLIAELVCTGVLSAIRVRVLAGDPEPLAALQPSLMELIVEPYLGAGAARADRLRDPSLPSLAPVEALILPVRAHPRIVGALRLIAASPGVSSREVEAVVMGRDTHGRKIWQVLKPLELRALIENTRPLSAPYERNAWRLTAYGRRALELVTDAPGPAREQRRPGSPAVNPANETELGNGARPTPDALPASSAARGSRA